MSSYYGFVPTPELRGQIAAARRDAQSGKADQPFYLYRDEIALGVSNQLLDNMLVQLIDQLPSGDRKETLTKMVSYVVSAVNVLLKQLLGKTPDEQALAALDFLNNKSSFIDADGHERVGYELSDQFVNQIKASFAAVEAGNGKATIPALQQQLKFFVDSTLKHFLTDFANTLDLGFIKRKAVGLADAGISKALQIGIDKLLPAIGVDELKRFSEHYNQFFVQV